MTEIVNLDELPPKLLAKEYKAVAKAVKNKDDDVKKEALGKLAAQPRYMTQGGCIIPLLEIMTPKKKTIAFTQTALEAFLNYLRPPAQEVADGEDPPAPVSPWGAPIAGMATVDTLTTDLQALKVLSALMIYKDEVKKVKPPKVKKGETPPPPPPPPADSELSIYLRRNSLKSVYYLTQALSNTEGTEGMALKFSEIEGMTPNLCDTIVRLAAILMRKENEDSLPQEEGEAVAEVSEAEPTSEPAEEEEAARGALEAAALEEMEWALDSLAVLVTTSSASCKILLDSPVLALLPILVQRDLSFTLPMLKIIHALALQIGEDVPGFVYATGPEVVKVLLEVTVASSEKLCAAEAGESGVFEVDDVLVPYLRHLDVLVASFTHMASMQKSYPATATALGVQEMASLIPSLNNVLLSPKAWEVSRTPILGGGLDSFTDRCCILLGAIAQIDSELRTALSYYPTTSTLIAVLQKATDIKGDVEVYPASEADDEISAANKVIANQGARERRIAMLRRAAEKAILTVLLSDTSTTDMAVFPLVAAESTAEEKIDVAADEVEAGEAGEAVEAPAPAPTISVFPAEELSALLDSLGSDDDLVDRAIRIIASLTAGSASKDSFASERLKLDPEASKKLVAVVLARAGAVLSDQLTTTASVPVEEAAGLVESDAEAGAQAELDEAPEGEAPVEEMEPAFAVPAGGPQDMLAPTNLETLYRALSVLQSLLGLGTDYVNAYAADDVVSLLAQLLTMTGPTCLKQIEETTALLYNAHAMAWVPSVDAVEGLDSEGMAEKVLLRPLILDTLTAVMSSDAKYREFEPMEGEEVAPAFPMEKGAVLPASASATEESALRVCRVCADVITAILSSEMAFCANSSESMEIYCSPATYTTPVAAYASAQEESVLKAALKSAAAIATCGEAGLLQALEAIATTGFSMLTSEGEGARGSADTDPAVPTGAMSVLTSFMQSITPPRPKPSPVPESNEEEEEGEGEEGGDGEGKGEGEADEYTPPTVAAAVADFSWATPEAFTDIIIEGLPTSARNVLQKPVLWPFLTILAPASAILANPAVSTEAADLALQVVASMTRLGQYASATQPAAFDVMASCFISMGGTVHMLGAGSAFGNLSEAGKVNSAALALELVSRGYSSEKYWHEVNTPAPPEGEEEEGPTGDDLPPHTGPSEALWASLLQLCVDSLHEKCPSSTALTTSLQGNLSNIGLELIARGSDVNAVDGPKLPPLAYALVLGQADVVDALLGTGALNVEMMDGAGNPMVKFSFLTLLPAEREALMVGRMWQDRQCKGTAPLASKLISAGVDVNSADAEGNSVLQLALGLSAASISIGGVKLDIKSATYVDEEACPSTNTYALGQQILNAGAKVNVSNRHGVTALHVAAARGHVELIQLFLHYNVAPCVTDKGGMLPLHYLMACCPTSFEETLREIMKISDNRPVLDSSFDDERVKLSKEDRVLYDIERAFSDVFNDSIIPVSISERRLSSTNMLAIPTTGKISPLQLLLSGHVLLDGNYVPFLPQLSMEEAKAVRMSAAVYFFTGFISKDLALNKEEASSLRSTLAGYCSDDTNFNCLHATALLLQGETPRVPLTPAQKRNKKTTTYESHEDHILAVLAQCDAAVATTQPVHASSWNLPEEWSVLMAATWGRNASLVRMLLRTCDLSQPQFIPMVSESLLSGEDSRDMTAGIISEIAASSAWASFLTPELLRAAVERQNPTLVALLVAEPKVDPNAVSGAGASSHTALHEAVEMATTEGANKEKATQVLKAFAGGADRLDMCVEDSYGNTCIDAAIAARHQSTVTMLMSMRRNDVIERVLRARNGGSSLLFELEEENMQRAKDAGYYLEEEPVFKPLNVEATADGSIGGVEVEAIIDNGEESEATIAQQDDNLPVVEAAGELEVVVVADAEIEVIDSNETNVTSYNPTTEADLAALQASNKLVKVLIDALQGLVTEDCHCHACYSNGSTYSEYCEHKLAEARWNSM